MKRRSSLVKEIMSEPSSLYASRFTRYASRTRRTPLADFFNSLAVKRIWEHKSLAIGGFTKRYGVHHLVWHELRETMESAIPRERIIKGWKRKWKLELIESMNPAWKDLYESII